MEASVELIAFLEEQAREVKNVDESANQRIQIDGDQIAFEKSMRTKASILASLAEEAALKGTVDLEARSRLEAFSASAARSLQVGSVFFMSALLYPEDHKPGEPNDLEFFISELKQKA